MSTRKGKDIPVDAPATAIGDELHRFIETLYPICRSITGDGVRETLRLVGAHIPLEIRDVPTGTPVLDWVVPNEWNIRDAYVRNRHGERVIDFRASNLHVLHYSVPVHRTMSLAELRPHLFTMPEHPELVPYMTSYYAEQWGFCLSQRALDALEEDEYEVMIDATLAPGHLTYGECLLPGATRDEILVSCHCCHPSLCNDNLSGVALGTFLARAVAQRPCRYSYRFVFAPGTIGAITWLALNEPGLSRIRHGFVVANVGDSGALHYKRSRRGNATVDRAVAHVLRHSGAPHHLADFTPYGNDERQYCSPAFNLPVGSLTRTPPGQYPEYHTSADDLRCVHAASLADSFRTYEAVFEVLEQDRRYLNLSPRGEPQLGRRGLYGALGGREARRDAEMAMLWVLNFSDGEHSLLDIAERSGLPFESVHAAARALCDAALLAPLADDRDNAGASVT